jgi:hypothetical protein
VNRAIELMEEGKSLWTCYMEAIETSTFSPDFARINSCLKRNELSAAAFNLRRIRVYQQNVLKTPK